MPSALLATLQGLPHLILRAIALRMIISILQMKKLKLKES